MTDDFVSIDILRAAIWKVKQMIAQDGPIHSTLLARLETKLAVRLEREEIASRSLRPKAEQGTEDQARSLSQQRVNLQ